MGIGVGRLAVRRSLKIGGGGAGSSPLLGNGKFVDKKVDGTVDLAGLDRLLSLTAAERRAIALNASIECVLIDASARASEKLKVAWPKFSAATLSWFANFIPLLFGLLALAAMFTTSSAIALSIIVVLPTTFRVFVAAQTMPKSEGMQRPAFRDTPDEELPVYSVITALHDEAVVVDQLLTAIERLDYPAEKLDVIIAVEADDYDTREAITARKHRIPITVIPIPPSEPRTKPKALNVALPFARGAFVVVYDAEDRPERDQLRRAAQAFLSAGSDLACVQARLHMDTTNSWLGRYFIAEYAGHFDVFLPKLAAFHMPLPLGGSSNHFRTVILHEVGGWDPHNVTEDADLGMRLARFGYRCNVIDSTTYEEAPANVCRWLGQRTRWFKGWMQTWLVHMREPRRLFRELGACGFITFQAVVGGNALVAIAHAALMLRLIRDLATLALHRYEAPIVAHVEHYLAAATFGYFVSAAFGFIGLWRRNVLRFARVLFWTPVHWLLLSAAAWWAAGELIFAPFRWRKTKHGLDKNAPPNKMTRSLIELERHLTDLKRRGELPEISGYATDTAVNRRRHPRAAV